MNGSERGGSNECMGFEAERDMELRAAMAAAVSLCGPHAVESGHTARPEPIRMYKTMHVGNEAYSCALLSLCPLVLLVTANQIPSHITSKMPKKTLKNAAKSSRESTVGGSLHSDSDEDMV